MQYGDLITRSLSIVWRHRYLWLLAILGGADVGSIGFNGNVGNLNPSSGTGPSGGSSAGAGQQAVQFLQDNLGLIVALGAVALLLAVAWFLLSCVTTGGLVRASAEHDADRPFRFGQAWRTGLATFGSILALRLIGLLLALAVVVVIGLLVLLGILGFTAGAPVVVAVVVVVGVLFVLALVPFGILAGILFILATRSIVLDQLRAGAALGRAFQLMQRRLGRTLLVWLIQVGFSIGGGIVALVPFGILVVLFGALTAGAAAAGGLAGGLVVGVPALLVVIAAGVLLASFSGAYFSTYWTLAFRRLDLDQPPQPAWSATSYPPYPPQPPPAYPAPRPQ